MNDHKNSYLVVTGMIGLVASILVGAGEFFLHFDPLARFGETSYDFMLAASNSRQTLGHFIGVLSAPLYLIGCWHIYLMLKPANKNIAFAAFLIGSYGFIMGGVWISSRASIGALVHYDPSNINIVELVDLYQLRYETLLTIVRGTTVILSLIFIGLVLTGKSNYRKWQAIFNPLLLLILNFIIYVISPEIGKYLMPIALNIGFGLFFIMSILQARKICQAAA